VVHGSAIERVRLGGYLEDGFPGHPSDGQHHRGGAGGLYGAVVSGVDGPAVTEVSDLDLVKVTDEAVAGGHVTVDDLHGLEVFHAGCHLTGHVDQRTVATNNHDNNTQMSTESNTN